MYRKPMDMHDVEAIATKTASGFRGNAERQLWLAEHRRMDGDELMRIASEIEQMTILLLEQYVREFEPLRDREALAPAKTEE